jgi:hypothetical protein
VGAPTINSGLPIISYTVTSQPARITAITNGGSTSVQVTGLAIGTSYTFTPSTSG